MNKNEIIAQVESSVSSIFTKEDVIRLINRIEDKPVIPIDDFKNKLLDSIYGAIEVADTSDIVDYCTAELEMSYNEVSLTNIEMNHDRLKSVFGNAIEEVFDEIENN